MTKRGEQYEYNKILNAFNAKSKTKKVSVEHLINLGFSGEQADNAVHVYWKGGASRASFILSRDERDKLLDNFNGTKKLPKDCVDYLMSQGCTYRQATSAVYKYRQDKGLIGK